MGFLECRRLENKMLIAVNDKSNEVITRSNYRVSRDKEWEISGNAEAEASEAGA